MTRAPLLALLIVASTACLSAGGDFFYGPKLGKPTDSRPGDTVAIDSVPRCPPSFNHRLPAVPRNVVPRAIAPYRYAQSVAPAAASRAALAPESGWLIPGLSHGPSSANAGHRTAANPWQKPKTTCAPVSRGSCTSPARVVLFLNRGV